MAEVEVLEARIEALESRVAELVAQLGEQPAADAPDEPARPASVPDRAPTDRVGARGGAPLGLVPAPIGRRRALGLAAGAAAAGVAAVVAETQPAAAANGQPFVLGSEANVATSPTGLTSNATGYGICCVDDVLNGLPEGNGGALFGHTKSSSFYAGVMGYAEGAGGSVGVMGRSESTRAVSAHLVTPGVEPAVYALAGPTFGGGTGTAIEAHGKIGLRTYSGVGTGVGAVVGPNVGTRTPVTANTAIDAQGLGAGAWGVRADGVRAPVYVVPRGVDPPNRTDAHFVGEIVADIGGDLWYCVSPGIGGSSGPGVWRKLSGGAIAGSLQLLPAPKRIYDSRPNTTPNVGSKTKLAPNTSRVFDVRANSSGVHDGATAVLLTVLLVNATAGNGNITIWADGVPVPAANSLVWGPGGGRFSIQIVTAVSSAGKIQARASLSTDLVLDVVGFYR